MDHSFQFHILMAVFLAAGLSLSSCQPASAGESQSSAEADATQNSSADQLQGTWKLLAAKWNADTKQFADNTMYKIFTGDRFAFVWFNPHDHTFTGAGGGTYTVDNGQFTETLEYLAMDSTAAGTSQTYDFKIMDDGILFQSGTLRTEASPNFIIREFYERVEPGIPALEDKHPLVGVWNIEEASYGGEEEDIAARYGKVLKIITPGHFYVAYFNPETGSFNGAAFGTWTAEGDQYIETIKAYSWDDSAVGKTYTFDWKVEDGKFYQTGEIDSDRYQDYEIVEVSSRVE